MAQKKTIICPQYQLAFKRKVSKKAQALAYFMLLPIRESYRETAALQKNFTMVCA